MTKEQIQKAISTLDALRRELISKNGDDPLDEAEYRLNPPATADDINQVRDRLEYRYSPRYQDFLSSHNGWQGFWPDWSLVGFRRPDTELMYEDIQENLKRLTKIVPRQDLDELPNIEKENPDRILITNHPIIATDFNGSFLALDQNRIDDEGEPEVAWVIYLNHVERRWKNFPELLGNAITSTRFELQGEPSA